MWITDNIMYYIQTIIYDNLYIILYIIEFISSISYILKYYGI